MILASHQCDLLPHSGFWHKMANADVMDISPWYQFQKHGYQRRVQMRGSWCSIPLVGDPSLVPIYRVSTSALATGKLADTIRGRYTGAPFWPKRGPELLDAIRSIHTDQLWVLNFQLLLAVRDMLGIHTPLAVSPQLTQPSTDGLVELCRHYRADTYLSGTGARVYLDEEELHRNGIDLLWSRHAPVTGESIVTVLMDHEDPLGVVLAQESA
jgi:hypothetical protein